MEMGQVLWFNQNNGYGYIQHIDGRELYFHYTAIAESGRQKLLSHGMKVSFVLMETNSGWEAADIRAVPGSILF